MGRISHPTDQTTVIAGENFTFASELKILEKAVYRGPHYFGRLPMIRIMLDLGRLEDFPTTQLPHFQQKLTALLPSLAEHTCSYGTKGGFLRRVEEGTWLGHVIEHVAIELQFMAGGKATRGKTRSVKNKTGVYNVLFAYDTEQSGLWAGRYAIELVNAILPTALSGIEGLDHLPGGDKPLFTTVEAAVQKIRSVMNKEKLGPTTQSIVEAAQRRGIPALRLDNDSLVQLGWGKNQRRIRGSITDRTSQIAVDAACDKALTKELLCRAGLPVPQGETVYDVEEAIKIAEEIGYPVVLKPLDGNHGRGVTTNINNADQVRNAFALADDEGNGVIVEQFYAGRDYRILFINGKLEAVAERVPAHVIGNSIHTVRQLIDIVNADPQRGDGHESALSKIVINKHVEQVLTRQEMTLDSIPASGKKIQLCDTANLSTGGTAIDRTDVIHPTNRQIMERAARTIGLDIAGIDVVAKDITKPLFDIGGGIVEVNASPGFRMHLHPSEGTPRAVGDAVVSMMFPENTPARVPVIAVTGTNGKSTTCRMIAQILRAQGKTVGYTSTSGIYINDQLIAECDASGPQSARTILRDTSIDVAVLETARGGIMREGLAFDVCNVGAVLNVTEDHLGLSGIDTIEDLAEAKSVVVEYTSPHGVSVLNADDRLTAQMTDVAKGEICFFSMTGGNKMPEFLRTHIRRGGMAVVQETGQTGKIIVLYKDGKSQEIVNVNDIPATLNGAAGFNVQNALAATAIAAGLDIPTDDIRKGLTAFASSFEQNPGRLNIHDELGFRIILDYAHNPAALTALNEVVSKMRPDYAQAIATVSTPGDRRDEDIISFGRIAAQGFDFLVFREDPDRRGRPPGEVNRLMMEGALSAGFPRENIICVGPEDEAIDICLNMASPGDLVALLPSDVTAAWQQARAFRPKMQKQLSAAQELAYG